MKKKNFITSRKRFIDVSVISTRLGIRYSVFDVILNQDIMLTGDEWDKLRDIELSPSDYEKYKSRIISYWEKRTNASC